MSDTISGYTNDDVNIVLKKVYENAMKDRDEALAIYNLAKKKIEDGSPDAGFLMSQANYLLQTANKNNEILVRLAGVIQRLQTNTIIKKKSDLLTTSEYNNLLELMDKSDRVDADFKLEEPSLTGEK